MSRQNWAPIDRQRGESVERWLGRNRAHRQRQWQQDKIDRGEWLPPEAYAAATGRPGKELGALDSMLAEHARATKAPAATQPKPAAAQPKPAVAQPKPASPSSRLGGELAGIGKGAAVSMTLTALQEVVTHGRAVDGVETLKKVAVSGAGSAARSAVTRGVEHLIARSAAEQVGKSLVAHGGKELGKQATKELGKQAAKELGKQATKELGKHTAAAAAKSALRGNAVGAAVGFAFDQVADTARLANGSIDGAEYGRRSVENVVTSGGGLGGAAAGAALGTALFPGVGTVIGGVLGGIFGSVAGGAVARAAVR